MESWKQKLGDHATYNCLMNAFKCAGYQILADAVKNLLPQTDEVQRDDDNYFGESFTSQPPPSLPPQQPVFPTIATKVLLHQRGKVLLLLMLSAHACTVLILCVYMCVCLFLV